MFKVMKSNQGMLIKVRNVDPSNDIPQQHVREGKQ